ncbi:AI-2E family transporter [Roseovarius spongiae]|uniref:AI-2E family transporter n=2 Tax=Roseovarius spongiae TaxID=2320272 RepID=A0A3A8AYZ1_9RHOB|nr:AI-2E family transporter [Roseovarius spongiae]
MVWASSFLIPITAAILSYLVFSRPRRWLARRGLPDMLIATIFTSFLFVLLGVAIIWFAEPVVNFIDELPELARDFQQELASEGGPLAALNEAATAIGDAVEGETEKKPLKVEVVSDKSTTSTILTMAPSVLGQVVFAIFLTFFLIGSGDFFARRTVESIARLRDKRRAVEVIHTIEERLGRYLGGIAVINAGLGLSIGTAMWFWGLSNYIGLGVMGFVLNFVPFLGAVAGAAISGFIAYVTLGDGWIAFGAAATYMALTSIEGQVVTPLLISRRMELNTPILFLVVAFFAYIWSVIGMVVAVPILIVAKIICDEVEGLQRLGYFLGDAEGSGAAEIDESG